MTIGPELIETIKAIAGIITALGVIFGVVFAIYRFVLRQKQQDEEIKSIKEENALVCYALRACLDGLQQLGANHTVPDAKERLEKHLNIQILFLNSLQVLRVKLVILALLEQLVQKAILVQWVRAVMRKQGGNYQLIRYKLQPHCRLVSVKVIA